MDTVPIVFNSNTIVTTSREPHKLAFCVNTESVCLFAFTLFTLTTKKVIFLKELSHWEGEILRGNRPKKCLNILNSLG